jgi:hypothetical protein
MPCAPICRSQIMEYDKHHGYPLSHSRPGPHNITGGANYFVDVYNTGNCDSLQEGRGGGHVAARIWILDSGDRGCMETEKSWQVWGAFSVLLFNATFRFEFRRFAVVNP